MRINLYIWNDYLYSNFEEARDQGAEVQVARYQEAGSEQLQTIKSAFVKWWEYNYSPKEYKFHEEPFATDPNE